MQALWEAASMEFWSWKFMGVPVAEPPTAGKVELCLCGPGRQTQIGSHAPSAGWQQLLPLSLFLNCHARRLPLTLVTSPSPSHSNTPNLTVVEGEDRVKLVGGEIRAGNFFSCRGG